MNLCGCLPMFQVISDNCVYAQVFAILLEYCCRTDYRMLISEISKEHKKEIEALDRDYQKKAEE